MAGKQEGSNNSPLSPSLEPVKHLSSGLQRKLVKRVDKQRKHFRSSGKPYPLVTSQSPSMSMEQNRIASFKEGITTPLRRNFATERDKAIIQYNLVQCGVLLTLSVFVFQALLSSVLSDNAQHISVIALAVAIPLLAGCFLASWLEIHFESFARGWNAVILLCSDAGAIAALIGIAALFWHLSEAAGWIFIGVSGLMVLVYGIYMGLQMRKVEFGDPYYDNRSTLD